MIKQIYNQQWWIKKGVIKYAINSFTIEYSNIMKEFDLIKYAVTNISIWIAIPNEVIIYAITNFVIKLG